MIARRHALRAAIIIQGMGIVKGTPCASLSTTSAQRGTGMGNAGEDDSVIFEYCGI